MLKLYCRNYDCARAAAGIFNAQNKSLMVLVRKFDETGQVQNKIHIAAQVMTNEPTLLNLIV